jgi:hypothetical protein
MTTTDEKANAFELLTSIRAAGWMVGAHNDYRINGVPMTFWLFTHPSGQWVKGEGMTDLQALEEAAHEAAITMDAPLRFAEPDIAPNPTDSTLPALAVISLSDARAALAAVARWRRGDGPGDAFTHSDFGKRLETLAVQLENAIRVLGAFGRTLEVGGAQPHETAFFGAARALLTKIGPQPFGTLLQECAAALREAMQIIESHQRENMRLLEAAEDMDAAAVDVEDDVLAAPAPEDAGTFLRALHLTGLGVQPLAILRNPDVTLEGEHEALQRVRARLGIDVEPDGTVSCPQHVDLHLQFAAAIFAKPISEITSDERLRTKRAGYFLAYGGAVEKAAAELGVPVERITAAMATHLPPVDHVVLASDSFGDGRAMWWDGDAISVFIENDSMLASDMKLGEVPPGISIWEGAFRFTGEASEAIPAPVGVFRAPTDSEWTAIRAGLSPWGS